MTALAPGEIWWVKLPDTGEGLQEIVEVEILELTKSTVVLRWEGWESRWSEKKTAKKLSTARFHVDSVNWVENTGRTAPSLRAVTGGGL